VRKQKNKTFDSSPVDALYSVQKEGVSKMRTSLLSCIHDDTGLLTSKAINSITVMRVYHQLSRIIRYLEIMDKLEDKLYESLEYKLDTCDVTDRDTLNTLLSIQAQLQKSMIESHKLLQPYMDLQDISVVDLMSSTTSVQNNDDNPIKIMSPESRDRIRTSAKNLITELGIEPPAPPESGGDADV
jgi:hypothetical protein